MTFFNHSSVMVAWSVISRTSRQGGINIIVGLNQVERENYGLAVFLSFFVYEFGLFCCEKKYVFTL